MPINQVPINTSYVAGIVLGEINNETRILLLKRRADNFWCQVTGKIEAGETAWQAILREIYEELAVPATRLYAADYIEPFYDIQKNCIALVTAFVARLPDNATIHLNDEHCDYGWFTLNEALNRVPFPNQQALLEHVWRYFVANPPSDLLLVHTD